MRFLREGQKKDQHWIGNISRFQYVLPRTGVVNRTSSWNL